MKKNSKNYLQMPVKGMSNEQRIIQLMNVVENLTGGLNEFIQINEQRNREVELIHRVIMDELGISDDELVERKKAVGERLVRKSRMDKAEFCLMEILVHHEKLAGELANEFRNYEGSGSVTCGILKEMVGLVLDGKWSDCRKVLSEGKYKDSEPVKELLFGQRYGKMKVEEARMNFGTMRGQGR